MGKIAFILPSLRKGGAERVTLNLIEKMIEFGYEVQLILFTNVIEYVIPQKVECTVLLRKKNISICDIPVVLYRLIVCTNDVNLVVGALELTATYFAVLLAKLRGLPVIGWVHTDIESYLLKVRKVHFLLLKLLYPLLDSVWVVSKNSLNSMEKICPRLKGKVKVMRNPVKIKEITRKSKEKIDEIDMTILDGLKDKPVVVSVGTLNNNKGFDVLIKACKILHEKGLQVHVIILGEGEERSRLTDLAYALGIEQFINLPGSVSNPYNIMMYADVFVQSSWIEGLPTVIVEALALGIPIVCTDSFGGGAKEILKDGQLGRLVKVGDEKEMADAINDTLNCRYILREKAYERALDFDTENVISMYLEEVRRFV